MNSVNLGIVSPVPQGEWSATKTYPKLSIVRASGGSYIARSQNRNIEPGVDESWQTYWMALNFDGATGTQGATGQPGEGVPSGGTIGQVLAKNGNGDYEAGWIPQSQIAAGSAVSDGNGNNIPDTYQTKQNAQNTYETKTDANEKNAALQQQITANSQFVTQTAKRITNVENSLGASSFEVDDTIAYIKNVPSNALPWAKIVSIGGMTQRINTGSASVPAYGLRDTSVTQIVSAGANLANQTLLIPAVIQSLPGYGRGVSAEYNNNISWDDIGNVTWNVTVKRKVFTGSENWSASAYFTNAYAYQLQQTYLTDYKAGTGVGVCSHFETKATNSALTLGAVFGTRFTLVTPYEMGFETSADLKAYIAAQYAAGTPVTIDYVIATPEITDISSMITIDNLIQVEGGGTITFENQYQYDPASEIKYQLEVTA